MVTIKHLLATALSSIIVGSAVSWWYVTSNTTQSEQPSSPYNPLVIQVCSGIPVADQQYPSAIAIAHCGARLKGIVEGHQLTLKLVNQLVSNATSTTDAAEFTKMSQFWCIDQSVSTQQLLMTFNQVVTNNKVLLDKVSSIQDPDNAALALIVGALHVAYPCDQ